MIRDSSPRFLASSSGVAWTRRDEADEDVENENEVRSRGTYLDVCDPSSSSSSPSSFERERKRSERDNNMEISEAGRYYKCLVFSSILLKLETYECYCITQARG